MEKVKGKGYLYKCSNCGYQERRKTKCRGYDCQECFKGCMRFQSEY